MVPSTRAAVFAALLTLFSTLAHGGESADMVVRNARIYTVDPARPWAEALAVKDGRIVFVGAEQDVGSWIGRRAQVNDAKDRLIVPGFHDTHVHMALTASKRHWCDLGYSQTAESTEQAIARCVAASDGKAWVLMANANTAALPAAGMRAGYLDSVERDRPLVVDAIHSSFANSEALRRAGIDTNTPDPVACIIVRDDAGRPTGTLRESAKLMMEAKIPLQSAQEFTSNVRDVLGEMVRHGVVSVQELTSMVPARFYADALEQGWLSTRVRFGQIIQGGDKAPSADELAAYMVTGQRYRSRWLNANTIKLYVDGDLGDQTAALLEGYQGSAGRGDPIWHQEQLDALVTRFDAAGMQVHLHAVGDRAVRMALDAIEQAQRVNGRRDARHQITHLHVIDDQDLARFAQLGVIANVQPYFATNIGYNTDRALELLGPERHRRMFRFRDLRMNGARLAVSTDTPVSPINPMVSIQAAVTRAETGVDAPAFHPEQRLSLAEALEAYTLGGAYANFLDNESGSLEVGKMADFVMLDQNLFEIPTNRIEETRILWTVLEGRDAYRSD